MGRKSISVIFVLCALLCIVPVVADDGDDDYKVYLPIVARCYRDCTPPGWGLIMSDWKIIVPEETTNLVINPSVETDTAQWVAVGANTIAQSSTEQAFGLYSLLCTYQNNVTMARYGVNVDAGSTYIMSGYIYVPSGSFSGTQLYLTGNWTNAPTVTQLVAWDGTTTNEWIRISSSVVTGLAGAGGFDLESAGPPNPGDFIYIDGFQLELRSDITTYCDGDQPGCWWESGGLPHATTSARGAITRAGGLLEDLKDDYNFGVREVAGAGAAQVTPTIDSFSLLPGGQLNNIKTVWRTFTMTGVLRGTDSDCDLHQTRQNLLLAIEKDAYPPDANGYQPVTIQYTGADVEKEIRAHYSAGLEGNIGLEERIHEIAAIRWVSPDPFWYDVLDSASVLDAYDTPTLRYITARLRDTGQWDDLGLTANPTTGGSVYAILRASDGTIYIGGSFTGWDGAAGRDYVANYDPATDTWSTVGGASDFNSDVYALVEGLDGTIYAGGNFTNCAGDANADGLAQWDGANWSAVGAGSVTSVNELLFDFDGNLIIGGNFNNFGGVANADNLAYWDGAAYGAVGAVAGPNGLVDGLALRPNGNLIIAGWFTTIGGVNADYIAEWDGSNFTEVANGLGNNAFDVKVSDNDIIYVCGQFTTDADANSLPYIGQVQGGGAIFSGLSTGANGNVSKVNVAPDGAIYAVGNFTVIGGVTLQDRIAKWNGSSWGPVDVDFPAASVVNTVETYNQDPTVPTNYDVYVGFSNTGASNIAGAATATNDGTAIAFPIFTVGRTGGGDAWLVSLRNERTGKEILFNNYYIQEDEEIVIDFSPTTKSVTSNFYGKRLSAVLADSDMSEFYLLPGDNLITLFVVRVAPATVTSWLQWKDTYTSYD